MKKKFALKWLCLSIALILLFTVMLTSCQKEDEPSGDSEHTDESVSDTTAENGGENGDGGENGNGGNEDNGGENNTTPDPNEKLDCIALTYGKYGEGAIAPNASSVHTIDNETGIVTIAYSSTQQWSSTRYILKTKFAEADKLPAKYRFVRVVYAAVNPEGSTPVRLMLRNDKNGGADDLVLDTLTEDTDGYTVSPTATLNIGLLQRYMGTDHNSLFFETAAEGGMYYIKGIYFFPTMAEADKMTVAYADKLLENARAEEEANKVPDGPTISMLFGENDNAFIDLKADENILSNTLNANNEVEISYLANTLYQKARYMTFPKFKTANALTDRYLYVRVQYSAQNPTSVDTVKMLLRDTAAGSVNDVILNPTVQTTSGFQLTKTAKINSSVFTRFMECKDNAIVFETNAEGGSYKIKGLYFFTSEEAANSFTISGVPEDKSIPFVLSFGTEGNATLTSDTASNVTAGTDNIKISYAEATKRTDSHYVLMPKFPTANPDIAKYKYIRVVYSAINPEGVNADMIIWNNATGQTTVLRAALTDTTGVTITDTVELKEDLGFMTRFATGGYNTIFFNTTADGGEYSIYKIYFFDTQADADAFTLT